MAERWQSQELRRRFAFRLPVGCRKARRKVAPQVGLEPATLRLTGGKSPVSRSLPRLAGDCRIAHRAQKPLTKSGLRFVHPFAALGRPLLRRKGKKRTKSPSTLPARPMALEDGELMPEGEDLRLEVEARPKAGPEGGHQRDERRGHAGPERYQPRGPSATIARRSEFLVGTGWRRSMPSGDGGRVYRSGARAGTGRGVNTSLARSVTDHPLVPDGPGWMAGISFTRSRPRQRCRRRGKTFDPKK
jgi:hypothetical protein